MLYLSSGEIAPALELLRRICQPDSHSLPHITARYSKLQVRPEALRHYSEALVDDLILSEVSTFDSTAEMADGLRTVVITCESEDLEWLSYKPSFPDSVFHFTVYDGERSHFAARVFTLMRGFDWNLRIVGASERLQPYDGEHPGPTRGESSLTFEARELLVRLAKRCGLPPELTALSDDERLELIDAVCIAIHESDDVESADFHPADFVEGNERLLGQHEFWSSREVNEFSPELLAATPDERESAMFLTPPELAYDVAAAAVALAREDIPVRFGDPAIGPGIFYAAIRRSAPRLQLESATGVEINPDRARATAKRWRRAGLKVVVGDFLTQLPPKSLWTVLLANPPYVRHQDIDRNLGWLRNDLRERTGIRLDGRSDLYMYFVLTAHDWLAEGAVAAWLLPAEFLSTDYGRALRDYLTSNVQLKRLHVYEGGSSLFDNARISSAVIIYARSDADPESHVIVTRGGTLEAPEESIRLTTEALRRHNKWVWAALGNPEQDPLRRTLGDYFVVKRGIATGANAAFVLDDGDLQELGVQHDWVRPLLPKSRKITSSIVEADEHGVPILSPRTWLIDTNEGLESIRESSPRFATYLESLEGTVGSRTLVRQRHPMYKQENREAPAFVFLYMAKSDVTGERRFIWNKSSAVVLNSYLGLTPKGRLADAVAANPSLLQSVHVALKSVGSEEFQRHGRPYVSGLLKLEPSELARISLDLEHLIEGPSPITNGEGSQIESY
jgi:hypothetical protein